MEQMDEKLIQQIADIVMRRLDAKAAGASPSGPTAPTAGPQEYFAPWTATTYLSDNHPSQQLFDVGEATEAQSAVRELVEFLETRECSIEKGKPCDHCGTCRSLGF